MRRARVALAATSVAIVVSVVAAATALGPDDARAWLLLCGLIAVATAVQGVTAEPRDLAPALLFSLPPVVALAADGSPTWLIGPLGAALLLAGELNALSWERRGPDPTGGSEPHRLRNIGRLFALGVGASLLVGGVARVSLLEGTVATAAAATALAAVGLLAFRGGT